MKIGQILLGRGGVNGKRELRNTFKEMNYQKIKYFLHNMGADYMVWHRNPTASRHMGGTWERQIWSAQNILLSLLNTHGGSLNDKSLRMLLA